MGRSSVKIIADTNILVRAVIRDDAKQSRAAIQMLREAELIAVPLPVLCEFAWVLRRVYSLSVAEISAAIETLIGSKNVTVNRVAVEAGLDVLQHGGDFADGLIAFEGRWLGGETFVSCDKQAVTLIASQGQPVRLLS